MRQNWKVIPDISLSTSNTTAIYFSGSFLQWYEFQILLFFALLIKFL
jgi:hypothetical protein